MAHFIYKFPLEVVDFQEVQMPQDSEILCVQTQNNKPCIWAKVDVEKVDVVKKLCIYGTGQKVNYLEQKESRYIGTFQLMNGDFVMHLFEVI